MYAGFPRIDGERTRTHRKACGVGTMGLACGVGTMGLACGVGTIGLACERSTVKFSTACERTQRIHTTSPHPAAAFGDAMMAGWHAEITDARPSATTSIMSVATNFILVERVWRYNKQRERGNVSCEVERLVLEGCGTNEAAGKNLHLEKDGDGLFLAFCQKQAR